MENIQLSTGRSNAYELDRGGMPAEPGPFVGIVKNNFDSTRTGRLQVYIKEFGGNEDNPGSWKPVRYLPSFYGTTNPAPSSEPYGTYMGNKQSYGVWFVPPDIGVKVLCVFAAGDPSEGYYIGCIPEDGIAHMVPAIGAKTKDAVLLENADQKSLFADATMIPVTEINDTNIKAEIVENQPTSGKAYYDRAKPAHAVAAAVLWQQGLITDNVRGPITSSSQRESPSSVYGISTPGAPIYKSGVSAADIQAKLDAGQLKPSDIQVVGRMGGHTFVMDDGDISGDNALVRFRTSKGHQIMLNDSGDCIHIIHANGQSWIELGKEGTLDVFSTNSVNIRTEGSINLHADKDINMYAGGNLTMEANTNVRLESRSTFEIYSEKDVNFSTSGNLCILSDGSIAIDSGQKASVNGATSLDLNGGKVFLNTNAKPSTTKLKPAPLNKFKDVKFASGKGWSEGDTFESVTTRAPTHEPYPFHNQGVSDSSSSSTSAETTNPSVSSSVNVST